MLGFQAEGASPLVAGHDFEHPETVASAIRIGAPASKEGALAAARESGGLIESVTDEEILAAQALLAREEGVFCEPASAAGVAGLLKLAARGQSAVRDRRERAHRSRAQGPDAILGPSPARRRHVRGRRERMARRRSSHGR